MTKLRAITLTAVAMTLLASCAPPPPANPMERAARLAAAAEIAARNCPGQLGGYNDVARARQDSNRNIALARQLGATDAEIQKARQDVRTSFDSAVIWIGQPEACNQLVGTLAWETS